MKRIIITAGLTLGLAACSPVQLDKAQGYQAQIAAACQVAMALAPMAPTIAPWIIGGCSTEAAIAKLALDAGSLIWVNDLAAKARVGS